MKKSIRNYLITVLAAAAVILIVPQFFSGYRLKVINISLIYSLLSLSLAIMLGMGGQMSFASVPFMGLGAYVVANLCSKRWGFTLHPLLGLLIAVTGVAVFGFLLGLVLLRLKGVFFTFSTIAFATVAVSIFSQYRPLFGGPDGIMSISGLYVGGFKFNKPEKWFVLMVILVLITAMIVERIRSTKFGRSLACIRDNDTAALTLGVDTFMTRVYAFTCQAAISALAGGLYALLSGYVGADMFAYDRSMLIVVMVMLGGINSTAGCITGAFVVTVLPELLRAAKSYLNLSFGLLVILFMIFMADGMAGFAKQLVRKFRRGTRIRKGGA